MLCQSLLLSKPDGQQKITSGICKFILVILVLKQENILTLPRYLAASYLTSHAYAASVSSNATLYIKKKLEVYLLSTKLAKPGES